jgi:hypothetical protein
MNRAICLSLAALLTTSSAAGCAVDVAATCKAAGGTYAGGTCTQWGPSQQAAREGCSASGGVYLGGSNTCVLGSGGP